MREYAALYNCFAQGGKWSVIFKDPEDGNWTTLERGLTQEIAEAAVKGLYFR